MDDQSYPLHTDAQQSSLWGVLVSTGSSTELNGLLSYVQDNQHTSEPGPDRPSASKHRVVQGVLPALLRHRFFFDSPELAATTTALIPLWGERIQVGRLSSNDVELGSNPCVSSVHCAFSVMQQGNSNHSHEPLPVGELLGDVLGPSAEDGSDGGEKAVTTASDMAHAQQQLQQQTATTALVALSDFSTNGCFVNGNKVGKGNAYRALKDGDVVDLMYAGQRYTNDYNLQFVFHDWEGFKQWLSAEEAAAARAHRAAGTAASETPRPTQQEASASSATGDDARRTAKRKALLLKAQWNVAAAVDRMYTHDVEDHYTLDLEQPLGEGAFGKVYRGALKHDPDSTTTTPLTFPPLPPLRAATTTTKQAPAVDQISRWTAAEEERQRNAYVTRKALEAPAAAVAVQKRATPTWSEASGNRSAKRTRLDSAAAWMAGFPFAVKIIRKQRMLLEAVVSSAPSSPVAAGPQQQQQQPLRVRVGGNEITVSDTERKVLQDLILLETQPDDLARRREHEWKKVAMSPSQVKELLLTATDEALQPPSALLGEFTQTEQCRSSDRQRRRQELLAELNPSLRRSYEKELQQLHRQQCEVNILLSVCHPHVTQLYEVFDGADRLSLVMAQASGGEAWDLLQAAPQRENASSADEDKDIDCFYGGGPLPEFLVKIIITQVLEAVRYLHSMGIVHRDLKLENLLLQNKCSVHAFCTLQLELFVSRMEEYARSRGERVDTHGTDGAAAAADSESRKASHPVPNPLSPLYTVHVPRPLWPVIQVTDFGLSRMLGHAERSPTTATTTTASSGEELANKGGSDALLMIYKRNEMMTACGTPVYVAPEVTNPSLRPGKTGYTAAVDMFSVGVIAYALLTGRTPFPMRKNPQYPQRPPVVDYQAPMTWDRSRKRNPHKYSASISGGGGAAGESLAPSLPPLACAGHIRRPPDHAPAGSPTTSSSSKDHTQWMDDMHYVSGRVRQVAERRSSPPQPQGDGDSADDVFSQLVERTVTAVRQHAATQRAAQLDADIDRLVVRSLRAVDNVKSDTPAVVVLPPISPLAQHFISGLLQQNPERRATASEALQHPWLRDCQSYSE